MWKKFIHSNYFKATYITFAICAAIHYLTVIIFSLINKDLTVLNLFKILALDLFFPGISLGMSNLLLSYLHWGMGYLTILYLLRRK